MAFDWLTPGNVGAAGTGLQIGGIVNQTIGAYRKSSADKTAYEYQSKIASNNAMIADWQANDANYRGKITANKVGQKAAQLRGSQEASLAARGLDLGTGSPLDILTNTDFMKTVDMNTAEHNADMEEWGLRQQALNYRANSANLQARADVENPTGSAFSTLLTGAGSVASGWYSRSVINAPLAGV